MDRLIQNHPLLVLSGRGFDSSCLLIGFCYTSGADLLTTKQWSFGFPYDQSTCCLRFHMLDWPVEHYILYILCNSVWIGTHCHVNLHNFIQNHPLLVLSGRGFASSCLLIGFCYASRADLLSTKQWSFGFPYAQSTCCVRFHMLDWPVEHYILYILCNSIWIGSHCHVNLHSPPSPPLWTQVITLILECNFVLFTWWNQCVLSL